jgi:hypothetical protein
MSEWHPLDVELARLGSEGAGDGVWVHVHACSRCQRVLADDEWLEERLAGTLKRVGSRIPVPQPMWRAVRSRTRVEKHRESVRMQASAVVTGAMIVCLLLCIPGVMRPGAAAVVAVEEVPPRPTPTAVTEATEAVGSTLFSRRSAVAAVARPASQSSPDPAPAPLPTPPDLEP